jgi:hypothetical protein
MKAEISRKRDCGHREHDWIQVVTKPLNGFKPLYRLVCGKCDISFPVEVSTLTGKPLWEKAFNEAKFV